MSSNDGSYSSLFTAGLFGYDGCIPSGGGQTIVATVKNPTAAFNLLPPPTSPTRKRTNGTVAPRRRRRSSVTVSSSPMSAVKSPVQRVHYAQRAVQRNSGALIAPESKEPDFRPNSIWSLPEQHTLSRPRKSALPALRKAPPNAPLPDIPSVPAGPRKDSITLPLLSPTFLRFSNFCEPLSPVRQQHPSLLAPSPILNDKAKSQALSVPVQMCVDGSSPILGSFPDIDGEEQHGMTLE